MPYVSNAQRDVFISYPLEAELWAEHFEQDLKSELKYWLPPHELSLYLAKRDWKCSASDAMLDQAFNSALFVAILTPGALVDGPLRFSKLEWDAFVRSEDAFGSVDKRFIPILLKPISSEILSKSFPVRNSSSFWAPFEFFSHDKSGVSHTLQRSSRRASYLNNTRAVANVVKEQLLRIKRDYDEYRDMNDNKIVDGPFVGLTVLLSGQPLLLMEEWKEIKHALLNDGVKLIFIEQENAVEIDTKLNQVDLFVEVLDLSKCVDRPGYQGGLLYEHAVAYLKSTSRPFSILQWSDPRQARVSPLSKVLIGPFVAVVGLQQFKRIMRNALQSLKNLQLPPPRPDRQLLFILADLSDKSLAEELREAALDFVDADILTEEESDRREHFVDAMGIASGMVFLHGKAPVNFVNNWLSLYVREKAKLKRDARMDAFYRAPPSKRPDQQPRMPTRDLRSLGSDESLSLEDMRQLCQELCGPK